MSTFLFCAVNNFVLYFIYILLGGITVTFLKGEKTLELLTTAEDNEVSQGKRRNRSKMGDSSASQSFKGLIEWTFDWMP